MPDLTFNILSADVKPYAAVPTIIFKLQITNEVPDEEVYAVGLKSQIRIEAVQRKYEEETKQRLVEVFGKPKRWAETLKSLYWKTVTIPVPRFTGQTVVDVPLECSEDMAAATDKYMYAIEDGDIPLAFIFNGSVFYKGEHDNVQVTPVPWEKEAEFKMPVQIWNNLYEIYYPDTKWLRVPKDMFDKLYIYKSKSAHPTLNKCLESLIEDGVKEVQNGQKQE